MHWAVDRVDVFIRGGDEWYIMLQISSSDHSESAETLNKELVNLKDLGDEPVLRNVRGALSPGISGMIGDRITAAAVGI